MRMRVEILRADASFASLFATTAWGRMCQRSPSQNLDSGTTMRITYLAFIGLLATIGTAHADCTSEVNDAFAKLRKSSAFRMETKITNPQGTLTMSNDYVLPDRMHQSVSMSGDGAPGAMEMILIGGKAWSNQGNAGWAEVPDKFATTIAKQMKETVVEPPKDQSQFECLGEVTFEGKTYAGYRTKRAPAKPRVPQQRRLRPMLRTCRWSTSTKPLACRFAIS